MSTPSQSLAKLRLYSDTNSSSYQSNSTATSKLSFHEYDSRQKSDKLVAYKFLDDEEKDQLQTITEELWSSSILATEDSFVKPSPSFPSDTSAEKDYNVKISYSVIVQTETDQENTLLPNFNLLYPRRLSYDQNDITIIYPYYFEDPSKKIPMIKSKSVEPKSSSIYRSDSLQNLLTPKSADSNGGSESEDYVLPRQRSNAIDYSKDSKNNSPQIPKGEESPSDKFFGRSPKSDITPISSNVWQKLRRKGSHNLIYRSGDFGNLSKDVQKRNNTIFMDEQSKQMCYSMNSPLRTTRVNSNMEESKTNASKSKHQNPLREYCNYGCRLTMNGKELLENFSKTKDDIAVNTKPDSSCIKIERVLEFDNSKILNFISNIIQENDTENLYDRNRREEKVSDEPYLIYKKGNHDMNKKHPSQNSAFFTNIQAIDLEKLLDLICKYKTYKDPMLREKEESERQKLIKTLLFSHDICCSSVELLIKLIKRYFIPSPKMMCASELRVFESKIVAPSQIQILDIFILWIESREQEFCENMYLQKFFEIFLDYAKSKAGPNVKGALDLLIMTYQEVLNKQNKNDEQSFIYCNPGATQRCVIYSKRAILNVDNLTTIFFKYTSDQIAEQMTKIDFRYLKSLRIWHLPHNLENLEEFISNEEKRTDYQMLVDHTNFLTFFLVYIIIGQQNCSKRIQIVARLLDIAEKLLALKNFQSFGCIMGALLNTAVKIQKKSLNDEPSLVSIKRMIDFENLFSNTSTFRKSYKSAAIPKIPSIMVITEDLSKLLGMQDSCIQLETRKLINFKLMEETTEVIDCLTNSQKSVYEFKHSNNDLQTFLIDNPVQLMRKLSKLLNISDIQTQLMAMAQIA